MNMDKIAYTQEKNGRLFISVIKDANPRVDLRLDLGIPNEDFSLSFPFPLDEPSATSQLVNKALEALLESAQVFLLDHSFKEELIYELFASVYEAVQKELEESTSTTLETIQVYEIFVPLPDGFHLASKDAVVQKIASEEEDRKKCERWIRTRFGTEEAFRAYINHWDSWLDHTIIGLMPHFPDLMTLLEAYLFKYRQAIIDFDPVSEKVYFPKLVNELIWTLRLDPPLSIMTYRFQQVVDFGERVARSNSLHPHTNKLIGYIKRTYKTREAFFDKVEDTIKEGLVHVSIYSFRDEAEIIANRIWGKEEIEIDAAIKTAESATKVIKKWIEDNLSTPQRFIRLLNDGPSNGEGGMIFHRTNEAEWIPFKTVLENYLVEYVDIMVDWDPCDKGMYFPPYIGQMIVDYRLRVPLKLLTYDLQQTVDMAYSELNYTKLYQGNKVFGYIKRTYKTQDGFMSAVNNYTPRHCSVGDFRRSAWQVAQYVWRKTKTASDITAEQFMKTVFENETTFTYAMHSPRNSSIVWQIEEDLIPYRTAIEAYLFKYREAIVKFNPVTHSCYFPKMVNALVQSEVQASVPLRLLNYNFQHMIDIAFMIEDNDSSPYNFTFRKILGYIKRTYKNPEGLKDAAVEYESENPIYDGSVNNFFDKVNHLSVVLWGREAKQAADKQHSLPSQFDNFINQCLSSRQKFLAHCWDANIVKNLKKFTHEQKELVNSYLRLYTPDILRTPKDGYYLPSLVFQCVAMHACSLPLRAYIDNRNMLYAWVVDKFNPRNYHSDFNFVDAPKVLAWVRRNYTPEEFLRLRNSDTEGLETISFIWEGYQKEAAVVSPAKEFHERMEQQKLDRIRKDRDTKLDAEKTITKFKNNIYKSRPGPLYMLLYDRHGNPKGTARMTNRGWVKVLDKKGSDEED